VERENGQRALYGWVKRRRRELVMFGRRVSCAYS
jgi:hypothetical protein